MSLPRLAARRNTLAPDDASRRVTRQLSRGIAPQSSVSDHLQRMAGNRAIRFLFQANLGSQATSHATVQRELVPGFLNIAGESHPEIDEERERRETEFARERLDGAYWSEAEAFDDKGFFGDDPYLRALDALNAARTILESLAAGNFAEAKRLSQWAWEAAEEKTRIDVRSGSERRRELVRHTQPLLDIAERAEVIMKRSGRGEAEKAALDKDDTDLRDSAASRHERLTEWLKVELLPQELSTESISMRRSTHMLDSALEAAKRHAGLWKVGNDHIAEMEPLLPEGAPVTLTDKTGFDSHFGAWESEAYGATEQLSASDDLIEWPDELG